MIKPVFYHKKLEGKSNAHLITFNDGKDYAVKFFQPDFERTLPNEWLGYCLARYLQLPVPFGRIVDIPPEFLLEVQVRLMGEHAEETPKMVQADSVEKECSPVAPELLQQGEMSDVDAKTVPDFALMSDTRYQFASLYVPNCVDGHQVSDVSTLTNSEMLSRIILFDYWLVNQDRTRKNILFQEQDRGAYSLWAIDHAEVLGGFNWEQTILESLPVEIMKSTAHKLMASFIESEEEFYEQLELIQSIPVLLIEEMVALIPDEWGVSKEERKAIVTSLLHRRYKVLPKLMERFIHKIYRPIKEEMGEN